MAIERARAPLLRAAALCALLSLLSGGQCVKISHLAVPKSVVVGVSVELQCQYDLAADETENQVIVKWWWTPLNGSLEQSKQLYQRIGTAPAQLVQPDLKVKDKDTIELTDLQPEDSGVYECEVATVVSEARDHQNLFVYTEGTGPVVNATLVDDSEDAGDADDEPDVLVTCEASDVSPEPDLAIYVNSQSQKVQQWVSAPEGGRYNVTANATVGRALADGAEIRCELFYSDDSISHPVFDDVMTFEIQGAATTTELPPSTTELYDEPPVTEQDNGVGALSAMPAILALSVTSWLRHFC